MFATDLDIGGAATAALGMVGASAIIGFAAALAVFRDLRAYVLPHFKPPRPGDEDTSLPARTARQEANLARHLDDEEGKVDAINNRLDAGDARMARIEATLGELHDEVRNAIAALSAGNPEIRP